MDISTVVSQLNAAVQAGSLQLDEALLTSLDIDTTAFQELLQMIPATELIINPVNAIDQPSEYDQSIYITGSSTIYGIFVPQVTIIMAPDDEVTNGFQWTLEALIDGVDFDLLYDQNLLSENDLSSKYLPNFTFDNVNLLVNTRTGEYNFTTTDSGINWSISGISAFAIENVGFTLSMNYTFDPFLTVTTNFGIIGHIQLGQSIGLETEVELINPYSNVANQWNIKIASDGPLIGDYNDLSSVLYFNNLNNLMPSSSLEVDTDGGANAQGAAYGVYLNELSILLDTANYSIPQVTIDVYASTPWSIGTIDFDELQLQMGIAPTNATNTLSYINLALSMTLTGGSIDDTVIMVRLSIDGISHNWSLLFQGPASLTSLADIIVIPGLGVGLADFAFPDKLLAITDNVFLNSFEIVYDPVNNFFPKLGISASVGQWNLIDGLLSLDYTYLNMEAINANPNGVSEGDEDAEFSYVVGSVGLQATMASVGVEVTAQKLRPISATANSAWLFRITARDISIQDMIAAFLGDEASIVQSISQSNLSLQIPELSLSVNTGANTYSGSGEVVGEWDITIGGHDLKLSVDVSADVNAKPKTGVTTPANSDDYDYDGSVIGILEVDGVPGFSRSELKITFTFGNVETLMAEFLGATLIFDMNSSIIKLSIGDWSVGEIIEKMVDWALPGSGFKLSSPWNILNDISLKNLFFTFDLDNQTFGIEYSLSKELNFGFVTISALSLSYGVETTGTGESATSTPVVDITLVGSLFGKDIPSWNVLDPDSAPDVPGEGDEFFSLDYVGIGQRVTLSDFSNINTLTDALTAYENAFKPTDPNTPNANPLLENTALVFAPDSNWMIGTQFTLLSFLNLGLVFNDPNLYGLHIGLKGEKAKSFNGLEFDIMYKKVSDSIGMFGIELQLPDIMRHLEFGEVSITIPVVGIEIFTNGNFMIDIGFPENNDFSKAFTLEIFPFIGAGGFYFGWLSGETSTAVPQISNGTFTPVIQAGIGAQFGIGKTIDEGVFSLGLSLTLQGIFEGVFAFFNSQSGDDDSIFLSASGTFAIVGTAYGSVNLGIIKASINATASGSASTTFEVYKAILISFELKFDFSVSATMNMGLFKINISMKFTLDFKADFTLGKDSTPPWEIITDASTGNNRLSRSLEADTEEEQTAEVIQMLWNPIETSNKQTLDIYFLPVMTGGFDANEASSTNTPNSVMYNASLFMPAPPQGASDGSTAFEKLAQAVLVWAIHSDVTDNANLGSINDYDTLLEQYVSAEALNNIYTYLSCQPGVFIGADDIDTFLENLFVVNIIGQSTEGSLDSAAAFPMLPVLELSATYNGTDYAIMAFDEQAYTSIDFSSFNTVDTDYQEAINAYFESLTVAFQTPLEAAEDSCAIYDGVTPLNAPDSSMASFIMQDYFLMLAKSGISDAQNYLKSMPIVYDGSTLNSLAGAYSKTVDELADANKDVQLNDSLQLQLSGTQYSTTGLESLDSVAVLFNTTAEAIATNNRLRPGLIEAGITITPTDDSLSTYTTNGTETFQSLADSLAITDVPLPPSDGEAPTGTPTYGSVANLLANTDIAEQVGLIVVSQILSIAPISYETESTDTFSSIVQTFAYDTVYSDTADAINDLAEANAALPNLFVVGASITVGSNSPYSILAGDTLQTLAARLTNGDIPTLMADISDQADLIAAFAPLALADLPYSTNTGDSLSSIATAFSTNLESVAENMADLTNVFLADSTVYIPDVASIKIQELLDGLLSAGNFSSLAAMTAQFLLHGLRLPSNDEIPETRTGNWTSGLDTYALYQLTGQEISLPTFQAGDSFTLSLSKNSANSGADWIKFTEISDSNPNPTVGNVSSLELTMNNDDIDKVSDILANELKPTIEALVASAMFHDVGKRYPFRQTIPWQYDGDVPLWDIDVPEGQPQPQPSIWPFPNSLLTQMQLPKAVPTLLNMFVGSIGSDGGFKQTAIENYSWSLMIPLSINQVAASSAGDSMLPNTYEIVGTTDEGNILLAALLNYIQDNNLSSLLQDVHILYSPDGNTNNPGLMSYGLEDVSRFIVQTNLSTETNPASRSLSRGLNSQMSAQDMAELVWEASIVRTGGYFLYYAAGDSYTGLPEGLFDGGEDGQVTLLFTFDQSQLANEMLPFLNSVAIGDTINQDQSLLFGQVQAHTINLVFDTSKDTLASISQDYNIWIDTLATAVSAINLNTAASAFVLNGIVYEAKTGDTLSSIANRFGVNESDISALNPSLTLENFALVNIPTVTYQPGTNAPDGSGVLTTLSAVADYFGLNLAALGNQIQENSNLFTDGTVLTFEDEAISRIPNEKPGSVAFDIQRTAANSQEDSSISTYMESLFSLLGYKIMDNAYFSSSGEGLPTSSSVEDGDDTQWFYHQVVPIATLAKQNNMISQGSDFPSVSKNPYAGVGTYAQVQLGWRDFFGNMDFPESFPTINGGEVLNALPLPVGYIDALARLEKWPNVGASYLFNSVSETNTLQMLLNFDVSKYAVFKPIDSELNDLTDPNNPSSITKGEQFDKDLEKAKMQAAMDLLRVTQLFYQLNQQDISFSLASSIDPDQVYTLDATEKAKIIGFVNSLYTYLSTVMPEAFEYTYYTVQSSDIVSDPNNTLIENAFLTAQGIADAQGVDVRDLLRINKGLTQAFSLGDFQIIIPIGLSLPQTAVVQQAMEITETMDIFELTVSFGIHRSPDLVHPNFLYATDVASAISQVKPIGSNPQQASEGTAQDGLSKGLTAFAQLFESTCQTTGSTYKIALGESKTSTGTLWVVNWGSDGISFTPDSGSAVYFAPTPLATNLVSSQSFAPGGITTQKYEQGTGLSPTDTLTQSYSNINIDTWGQSLLEAIDTILLAQYSVPAYIIDNQTGGNALSTILSAKNTLADALVSTDGAVPRFAPILTSPVPNTEVVSEAQEKMKQELLKQLGNAYSINSVVQMGMTATYPNPETGGDIVPNLYGQPIIDSSTDTDSLNFSLSTAKIPLITGNKQSHLTFIFNTLNPESQTQYTLPMSFQVNHIEHQIESLSLFNENLNMEVDYNDSTWLSFVIPIDATSLGSELDIPVPLRVYPNPPSIISQEGVAWLEHNPTPDPTLAQEQKWDFQYTFDQLEAAQDQIITQVSFNVDLSRAAARTIPADKQLFADLAQFNAVYTSIWQDITDSLVNITPETDVSDDSFVNAQAALQAFAQVVQAAANSWADWVQPNPQVTTDNDATEVLSYIISETPQTAGDNDSALLITVAAYDAQTPSSNFPWIDIEGYTRQEVSDGIYTYVSDDDGSPLSFADRATVSTRSVIFPERDIMSEQNAWAAVAIRRNEELITGKTTTEAFIYQTPLVRFNNPLIPLLDSRDTIDISALPNAQPTDTLANYLANLFINLFEQAPAGIQGIKLEADYGYTLQDREDGNEIMVPIAMVPFAEIQLPDDYDVSACVDDSNSVFAFDSSASFVCNLTNLLKNWLANRLPSRANGTFYFDISIFSTFNATQMPLFRMRDLFLRLDKLTDV